MSDAIDFLPSRYREQNVRRRSRLWLLSILGFFASVIAITSSIQLAFQKQAQTQLTTIEFQHASAQATQHMFNRLQSNLASVRASASLYAFLESSWPRTQIIVAVSRPLTDEITLSELTIAVETEQEAERSRQSPRRRRTVPEAEQRTGLPAKLDLDTLREQLADKRTVVHLAGTTTDNIALHRYVSQLSNDTLFDKAELLSFESSAGQDPPSAEFLLRVTVRQNDPPSTGSGPAYPQDARRGIIGSRL